MFVFVESNTSGSGMLALQRAVELGLNPVLLSANPSRYRGLELTGCRVIHCDTNSVASLHNVLSRNIGESNITGIMTTSDFYLKQVSTLASTYGVIHNPRESLEMCRNKGKTRETLKKHSIAQPNFHIIKVESHINRALSEIGLPCIVKPVDDSGSNNVKCCNSAMEVKDQLNAILSAKINVRGQPTERTVLIEEYLEGQEYSVESFSYNGQHQLIGITYKEVSGFPYFVERRHLFPANLTGKEFSVIWETVESALNAVGFSNGASHTEVKLINDVCKVIEINPRLAGGMIPELIRNSTNIDLIVEQVSIFAGSVPSIYVSYRYVSGIEFICPTTTGSLTEIIGVDKAVTKPGVIDVQITTSHGSYVQVPKNAYDRIGYIISRGRTFQETRQTLEAASSLITVRTEAYL